MRRRLFNLAAAASLVLLPVAVLVDVRSHDANLHYWVNYASSDRWPVIVDGDIEFGWLGRPQPYVPISGKRGLSWSGPYPYSAYTRTHPAAHDADDNWARRTVFSIAGVSQTSGRVVPPWGWKDNVIFGDKPAVTMAYTEFRVAMVYPMLAAAILPLMWWRRAVVENRRGRAGQCRACGYDLRATPERCPECGASVVTGYLSLVTCQGKGEDVAPRVPPSVTSDDAHSIRMTAESTTVIKLQHARATESATGSRSAPC